MKLWHKRHRNRLSTALTAFRMLTRDDSGATALIFAGMAIPVMIAAGAAIDYSRAVATKTELQNAADNAALNLGMSRASTQSEREAIARSHVNAVMSQSKGLINLTVTETEPSAGTFQVTASATFQTAVMKLIGISSIDIAAKSTASVNSLGSGQKLEMALALDNTGSMANDMPALRTAAKNLNATVMNAATSGNIRISVVPYVAAVNPGLTDMSMVDTSARSPNDGRWFAGKWIAHRSNCMPVFWMAKSGGGGPLSGASSSDAKADASDLNDLLNPFRRLAREIFGVSSAYAADVTANTISPIILLTATSAGNTFLYPTGFQPQFPVPTKDVGDCEVLANPENVSNYELFNRTRSPSGFPVRWKGCVEARLSRDELLKLQSGDEGIPAGSRLIDYDTTDEPPNPADPTSLFVPYFWPDEPDFIPGSLAYSAPGPYITGSGGFSNNYLTDVPPPPAWNWTHLQRTTGQTILKYDGMTRAAVIQESPPVTNGPNASCPDAVQRLTTSQAIIDSKISGLSHWYNGGTIGSEGLMWAWRTLSPNAPYSDGAPYGTAGVKKVIVLMTDGVNGLADNGNVASENISDYSAYGYLGDDRLKTWNNATDYTSLTTMLDNRLLKACTNAKNAGVSIYTVLFSARLTATEAAHSQSVLQQCATSSAQALNATDAATLNSAFTSIAQSVTASRVRLVR